MLNEPGCDISTQASAALILAPVDMDDGPDPSGTLEEFEATITEAPLQTTAPESSENDSERKDGKVKHETPAALPSSNLQLTLLPAGQTNQVKGVLLVGELGAQSSRSTPSATTAEHIAREEQAAEGEPQRDLVAFAHQVIVYFLAQSSHVHANWADVG